METHTSDVGREDSRAGGRAVPSVGWGVAIQLGGPVLEGRRVAGQVITERVFGLRSSAPF